MAGEVARLTARVHKNPSDTTGYFSYNNNTYRYKYPAKGPHSYELATAQGDVDWKEIDRNSAAYQTLESKAPQAVKAEVEKPSLFEQIKRKFTPNKREFGGPISYSSYLQSEGILDQAPKELVELVIKALEGDQESGNSLSALIQENPEAEGIVQQIAEALTSDSSPAAMKCGGRVQKAEGGDRVNLPSIKTRKLEGKELSFVESTSAGKTRIDEYKDKEGNKYRYAEFTDHKGDVHKEYIFNGKKHKSGELHEEDMKKFTKPTKKAERGLKIGASKCGCTLKKVGGRLIEVDSCTELPIHKTGDKIQYAKFGDGIKRFFTNVANTAGQSGAGFTPGAGSITGSVVGGTSSGIVNSPAQPAAPSTPGLFTGDLRSYGARKQWVSDNAEYLKSQGWDDARIAGYRGSAADNIALQKAISGKSAWDAEQEAARQAAAAQRANDQQRQQKFVEEIAPSHPLEKAAIIPPKTPAIVKPQGLQPTAEQIKSNTLTAMLGQNTSDRRMAKYGKAYDFIKTGANSANMSAADTRRANRLASKMRDAGLMENGGQLNYANYLN